jgi:hypothetical protein
MSTLAKREFFYLSHTSDLHRHVYFEKLQSSPGNYKKDAHERREQHKKDMTCHYKATKNSPKCSGIRRLNRLLLQMIR